MAKVELYRKYRPQNLSEMVGNEATIKSLKAELEKYDYSASKSVYKCTKCGKEWI